MKFSNFFDKKITDFLKEKDHITDLLPIQKLSIPTILKKQNSIIVSATGSGKTLCFVLPVLVNLEPHNYTQIMVLLPTNELAKQTYKVFKHYESLFHNITIYNAFKKHKSVTNISSKIILSSPTEAIKLIKSGQLNIDNLKMLVLDEADMLLEFFKQDINSLFHYLKNKNNVQFCLFSATLHESLANLIKKNINNCKLITDKKDIWNNDNIQHYLVNFKDIVDWNQKNKLDAIKILLDDIKPFFCLLFVNSKKDADVVYKFLLSNNYKVGLLYSELNHKLRRDVLLKANKFEFNVLVCTDLASRGIDLPGVSDVISYDLPQDDLYYIHRAGRTGRGKYKGNSYILNTSNSSDKISKLKSKINFKKINF